MEVYMDVEKDLDMELEEQKIKIVWGYGRRYGSGTSYRNTIHISNGKGKALGHGFEHIVSGYGRELTFKFMFIYHQINGSGRCKN